MSVQDLPLGTVLREARQRAGLSQQALAHGAGLSLRTITRIEAGGVDCTVATLTKIAGVLGVTVTDLLTPTDEEPAEAAS